MPEGIEVKSPLSTDRETGTDLEQHFPPTVTCLEAWLGKGDAPCNDALAICEGELLAAEAARRDADDRARARAYLARKNALDKAARRRRHVRRIRA